MKKYGNEIVRIKRIVLEDLSIEVEFMDGFCGVVHLADLFSKPKHLTKEILVGMLFEKCFLEAGALTWPNGFQICPDAIKMKILQRQKNKAA